MGCVQNKKEETVSYYLVINTETGEYQIINSEGGLEPKNVKLQELQIKDDYEIFVFCKEQERTDFINGLPSSGFVLKKPKQWIEVDPTLRREPYFESANYKTDDFALILDKQG